MNNLNKRKIKEKEIAKRRLDAIIKRTKLSFNETQNNLDISATISSILKLSII